MTMNTGVISFKFSSSPESGDDQVIVLVDGRDLISTIKVDRIGVDPPEFFNQRSLLEGGDLLIARCGCGVVGCDDLRIQVVVTDNNIIWQGLYGGAQSFDREQYMQEIAKAASSTEWESMQRRAERLVSMIDFSPLEEAGYRFEWASARIGYGKIVLSFNFSGQQRLFEIGCDHNNPEDAVRNVRRWVTEFRLQ